MALFLPRRWNRQPTGPVRINYGNPLARGIIAAYPMWRGATWNAVGEQATVTGTKAAGFSSVGEFFDLDGASYLTRSGALLSSDTTPFTVSWYSVAYSVPTYSSIMGTRPTGSANPFFIIRSASSNYHLSAGPVAGLTTICAWTAGDGVLPALATGMEERMVLSCVGGTSSHNDVTKYRLTRNGVHLGNAPTAATAYGSSSSTSEVHGWDGGDNQWDGLFGDFIVWGRALSQAEAIEYSRAPYQIYEPLRRKLYFGIPAAGGSYTLTANAGSLTLTGRNATLLRSKLITANAGSLTLTGQSATLLRSKLITANAGTLTLTPRDATITYTPAGSYSLIANAGSLTLTGQTATLLRSKVISASAGTLTLTGRNATITYSGAGIWTEVSPADSTWSAVSGTTSTWTLS